MSFTDLAVSTGVGAITGKLGDMIPMPKISGLNAGRGSMQAVSRQLLTKLKNGTISNISNSSANKMLAVQLYNGVPGSLVDVVKSFISNGATIEPVTNFQIYSPAVNTGLSPQQEQDIMSYYINNPDAGRRMIEAHQADGLPVPEFLKPLQDATSDPVGKFPAKKQ